MIKIQNLTAGYGKTIVLSHINLELKNETYGIIGPNGHTRLTLHQNHKKIISMLRSASI